MNEKIYVIGHKSPDLDSVAAAITYASYKNIVTNTKSYIPAVAGEINQVTKFILDKYGFEIPEVLINAKDEKIILVDHNEESQMVDGGGEAEIIEVLDHHTINFSHSSPIEITIKPWGSSNSIIYKRYLENGIKISKEIAGLMLSAILDDTVITKSPTCTKIDEIIIAELAGLVGVPDWKDYGMEMFKVKASVSGMSADEIIKMDYKDFELGAGKFGIGQVEVVDLSEFDEKEDDLINSMKELQEKDDYHSVILLITDIINEGSRVLIVTRDQEKSEEALGEKIENNKTYVKGLMSRKKQIVPPFTEIFK
jgi:manganese-dependent inorganic pyrophosphatase